MFGNCAIGSSHRDDAKNRREIEITIATMGRLMKNFAMLLSVSLGSQ